MDPLVHALYLKHYVNKKKRAPMEVCIRCGNKGILGNKRPYSGLCKQCRKEEFKKQTGGH